MAQNITNLKTAGPQMPANAPPALVRTVQIALSGAEEHGAITVLLPGKELHGDERRQAEGRLLTLRRSLDHRDNNELAKAVMKLLSAYTSARGNADEARSTVASYAAVLSDLPPWAVAEACQAWVRGGYGATASAFAPSAPELHRAAVFIFAKFKREADDLERVLSARTTPITAEERSRVVDGFAKLRAELVMPVPPPGSIPT